MRAKVTALLAAAVLAAAACGEAASSPVTTSRASAGPSPTATATSSRAPSPSAAIPTLSPTRQPPPPSASPAPAGVASASLPVRADALTAGVALETTTSGGLFVAVSTPKDSVLALLDARGEVGPGWPVRLAGASRCVLDRDPSDGSVRATCRHASTLRAYALDAVGRLLTGWPVDLPAGDLPSWRSDPARVVDGDLYVVLTNSDGASLVRVARDGSLRLGVAVGDHELVGCCAAIGTDGTAYLVAYVGGGQPGDAWQTMLSGLTLDGLRRGYPLEIDGSASVPAFGADGRIYVAVDRADYTVETGADSSSQVLAIEDNGRVVDGWPVELPIDTGAGDMEGVGAPLSPLVASDGSVTVVGGAGKGTVAYTLGRTGEVRAGWPFRSGSWMVTGVTSVGMSPSGCGMSGLPPVDSPPQVEPHGTVYVAQRAHGDALDGGNRITAVDLDGDVRAGWPVTLTKNGAWFERFAVGQGGVVFGYVLEPAGTEPDPDFGTCKVFSGTIAALDAHGDPIYTTTLVAP